MKKLYQKPCYEISLFDVTDVLTSSPNDVNHTFFDDSWFNADL